MDGVRELNFRQFFLGEQTEGYRGLARTPGVRIRNMLVNRTDGSLHTRRGHRLINDVSTHRPNLARRIINFRKRDNQTGQDVDSFMLIHALNDSQDLKGAIYKLNMAGGPPQILREWANGFSGDLGEHTDMCRHASAAAIVNHLLDPFVILSGAQAGGSSFFPWITGPSVDTHYGTMHFACLGANAMLNAEVAYVPPADWANGPFTSETRRFYCFAFEYAARGIGPCVPDPLAWTPFTYVDQAGTRGHLRIKTPSWPRGDDTSTGGGANLGIIACHVFATRISPVSENYRPVSLADFYYAGKVSNSGDDFIDNLPDEKLGLMQPFLGAPLSLWRAKNVASHGGRLILGDLRSPRIALGAVGSLPGVNTTMRLEFLTSADWQRYFFRLRSLNAEPNLKEVIYEVDTPTDTTKLTLGQVVREFNARASLCKVAADVVGTQLRAGDFQHAGFLVMLGDETEQFVQLTVGGTNDNFYEEWITLNEAAIRSATAISYTAGTFPGDTGQAYTGRYVVLCTRSGTSPGTYFFIPMSLMHASLPSSGGGRYYPSHVQMTYIDRPWIPDPALLTPVGTDDSDEVMALAPYPAASGKNELLILKRRSSHRLVGDGIDVDGVPNFAIRQVSSELGCWRRFCWSPSPQGVYFYSYRGLEFYDGARVTPIPLSDPVRTPIEDTLRDPATRDQLFMQWYQGRVFMAAQEYHPIGQTTFHDRIYVYDEIIGRLSGDQRRGWSEMISGPFEDDIGAAGDYLRVRAAGVWYPTQSTSNDAGILGGELILGTYGGGVYRALDPNLPYDLVDNGLALGIYAFTEFRTIEPVVGRRVRFRTFRPRFSMKHLGTGLKSSADLLVYIQIDDRGWDPLPWILNIASEADELLPLLRVGIERSPRGRRVAFRVVQDGYNSHPAGGGACEFPLVLYGADIGWSRTEGSMAGAEK